MDGHGNPLPNDVCGHDHAASDGRTRRSAKVSSGWQGSNLRPTGYEPAALTTELQPRWGKASRATARLSHPRGRLP